MASEDGAAAREKDPANFDVLFAGVAVRDFPAARAWYEDFFAHPADVVAHENEVMWQVTDRAWLYVVCDTARAGQSVVTVAVPDIEEATATLVARGIAIGPIQSESDVGRKATARDPDGNEIAIIEVTRAKMTPSRARTAGRCGLLVTLAHAGVRQIGGFSRSLRTKLSKFMIESTFEATSSGVMVPSV
jgi:predicted enzyme related to lactoylglutathione lyase